MNKPELIDFIGRKVELPLPHIESIINALGDALLDVAKRGDSLSLVGIFTLSVKERAARTGRNPATGKTIDIAATKVPVIKAGTKLKEAAKAGLKTK